jgi:TonB-dependent receptor
MKIQRLLHISAGLLLAWNLAGGQAAEQPADAPAGSVSGQVVDTTTGEPLLNATVTLRDNGRFQARTDMRGRYTIRDVPAGDWEVVVFKSGYRFSEVPGIVVRPGEVTAVNVPLQPLPVEPEAAADDVFELAAFVVEAESAASTESVLLYNRRRSVTVTDAISEDRFSALGIGDAAQALAKTVGTTIVDGKYAVIRGLGDRYTNTRLNGLSVPSTDPDRMAVQLDQFPSDLLESVVTSKTFTADQPGAFSGGSVNLRTKSFPDQFFVKVGAGVEYNTQTTGKDVLRVPGGGRDWTGRDDGTRSLPSSAPDDLSTINKTIAEIRARQGNFGPAEELQASVELFDNRPFFPTTRQADPNVGWSLSFGDRYDYGEARILGYIVSFTYDRNVSHYEDGTTGRYNLGSTDPDSPNFVDLSRVFSPDPRLYTFYESFLANPSTPLGPPQFGVTSTSHNVDWGAYTQLAWQPSGRHEFNLRFFHNQSASDAIKRGVGEATRSDSGEMRENYDLLYTERGVTSFQLAGESVVLTDNHTTLEWRAAVSESYQDQPDYRSMEFKYDFRSQEYDPSGVNAFRFFRWLDEDNQEVALDLTVPVDFDNGGTLTLKTGGFYSDTERSSRERRFKVEGFQARGDTIPLFPQPVGILERTANSVRIGTYFQESPSNASYTGERTIAAGYLMADYRLNYSWRFIAGARWESSEIATDPILVSGAVARPGRIDEDDILPHASLVYSITDEMNLRLAYGSTLARPTFREMADITLIDPFTDERLAGNPDLVMTEIENYDLRWEWFPAEGEVLAASLFYKELTNPIELTFDTGRIIPQNVESGEILGLELEYRQRLGRWLPALESLSLGFNYTWIESEVRISDSEYAAIIAVDPDAPRTRELYGQSPYIFNLDLTWEKVDWGTTLSAVFNIAGERLDLVTTGALPDVFEQPAESLDLIWSQQLGGRWSMKLTAKNLLDPRREKTLSHAGTDYLYESYRRGRLFGISLAYQFD